MSFETVEPICACIIRISWWHDKYILDFHLISALKNGCIETDVSMDLIPQGDCVITITTLHLGAARTSFRISSPPGIQS